MDNRQFFILKGQRKKGPYSFEEIKNLNLSPDALLWYEGLTDWTPLSLLAELIEEIKKTSPPKIPPPTPIDPKILRHRRKVTNTLFFVGILITVLIIQPYRPTKSGPLQSVFIGTEKGENFKEVHGLQFYNWRTEMVAKVPLQSQFFSFNNDDEYYSPMVVLQMKDGFHILFDISFQYKVSDPSNFAERMYSKWSTFPESFNRDVKWSAQSVSEGLTDQYKEETLPLLIGRPKPFLTSYSIENNIENFADSLEVWMNKGSSDLYEISNLKIWNFKSQDMRIKK